MYSFLTIALLFSLLPLEPLFAQTESKGRIKGVVHDAETGQPVVGAHAFIGSTMIGTVTDSDGQFELELIPPGTHSLWLSMIGYTPMSEEFTIGDSTLRTIQSFELVMEPAVIQVGELTVTAKRDRRWKRRLNSFNKMFVGETPFAGETVITNAEMLDFDSNWLGVFQAKAGEPLQITNNALGYRVKYVLKEFKREGSTIRYDGDPLFEELTPETEEQEQRWTQNRELAFHGSFHHFLLALLDGKTKKEGFEIMHIPSVEDISSSNRRFGIDPSTLILPGSEPEEKLLSFHGVLEISYLNEKEGHHYLRWKGESPHKRPSYQTSWIRLTSGPTAIDANGEVIDPYGVTVYGYFAYERIADELPKEYRPDSTRFSSGQ